MQKVTTTEKEAAVFRQAIQDRLRGRIREAIEAVPGEELAEALGSSRHERTFSRRNQSVDGPDEKQQRPTRRSSNKLLLAS